jgi:hypothetical protein
VQRTADPLFPLHCDVVAAAVRELLIIDKKIDHGTMKMVKNTDIKEEGKILTDHGSDYNEHVVVSRSGSDNEADVNDLRLRPKVKRLCFEVSDCNNSLINSDPHVVPIKKDIFNHAGNGESLVDFIVERAMLKPSNMSDSAKSDPICSTIKEQHDVSAGSIRKVSDASDDMEQNNSTDFPSCVLSLVQSNIVVLHKSPSGSKLIKLTPQSDIKSDFTVPTSSILSFLRNLRAAGRQSVCSP